MLIFYFQAKSKEIAIGRAKADNQSNFFTESEVVQPYYCLNHSFSIAFFWQISRDFQRLSSFEPYIFIEILPFFKFRSANASWSLRPPTYCKRRSLSWLLIGDKKSPFHTVIEFFTTRSLPRKKFQTSGNKTLLIMLISSLKKKFFFLKNLNFKTYASYLKKVTIIFYAKKKISL